MVGFGHDRGSDRATDRTNALHRAEGPCGATQARRLLAAAFERIPPQPEAAEAPVSSRPRGGTPQDRTGGQQASTEERKGEPEEERQRSWQRMFSGFGE